ncbi:sialate O-acetylesterase [Coraliomargarita parva]|uniref:sialate O-acetylesterase n=1 Tax=Coraliomargarita parva TaxID=3014050 RepID=UPI0022B3584C|nr:sialate O-acetylesterase [Coraliomargarita parva]
MLVQQSLLLGLCIIGGLLPISGQDTNSVKIRPEKNYLRVSQSGNPCIESIIADDGNLSSLRFLRPNEIYDLTPNAHRPDFLEIGTGLPGAHPFDGARGLFFWQNEAVKLTDVQMTNSTTIVAEGPLAALTYDFSANNAIHITARNKSDATMQLLMVLDPTVCLVQTNNTLPVRTPVVRLWQDTIWFQEAGQTDWRIEVTGGDRIWGPANEVGTNWREGLLQVWEATLLPGETRQIRIQASPLPEKDAETMEALVPDKIPARKMADIAFPRTGSSDDSGISLYSPKDYQVFQRQSESRGPLIISGSLKMAADKVQAKLVGESSFGPLPLEWQEIKYNEATHGFNASWELPAGGWYALQIRALQDGEVIAENTVEHLGIGEVFVVCGQSNSTNYGQSGKRYNKTQTGQVVSFDGNIWRPCEDPLPGSSDFSQGGSPWTFFGDALVEEYHVPVAVSITGHGGAPVQYWKPGSFPFFWVMSRINQFGPYGFRAMLWHQGESSVKSSTEFYFDTLSEIIAATRKTAGWDIPWMVAQVSYHSPKEPLFETTRTAQKQLWEAGIALEGPDTDTLVGEDRAGIHLSTSGLKKHGEMWAEKISSYLDEQFINQ